MGFCDSSYFDGIQKICIDYLAKNYDLCYLSAMHHKNRNSGADTIIVGSSHAMNGIIESELTAAGDVIQFSISSQDLYYDLEHIRKALDEMKKPIKRCLINLGYYMLYQDLSLSKLVRGSISLTYMNLFGETVVHNWTDAVRTDPMSLISYDEKVYPKDLIEGFSRFWAKNALLEQGSYYGQLLERENCNMLGLKKVEWGKLTADERRKYAEDRVIKGHNKHIDHIETRKENAGILTEIVRLLTDNNIKVYFFITPYTDIYMQLIDSRYKEDIAGALDELPYPVEFLDMNDYPGIVGDEDFLDSDHLNLNGAHKATALLNEFIVMAKGEQ